MYFNDTQAYAAYQYEQKQQRQRAALQMQADRDRDPAFDVARTMARHGHEGSAVSDIQREGREERRPAHPTGRSVTIQWIPATHLLPELITQPVLL